ncbi:MAG: ribulose-phosphate 3-epimerase [Muribaculum sp.]|nr:ribulose-phosphate 3-epimerase [Muribaculum sp.]
MAIFSPSIMCADLLNLESEIYKLEAAGADRLHLDVMDGNFVPNYSFGIGTVKAICNKTNIETEIHLMVKEPVKNIELFTELGADIIYFHPQSDFHPTTVIERIKDSGVKPGIVLDPGTSVESAMELIYICNHVLIMGVNPGHAGQIYLPYVDRKIEKLLDLKEEFNIEITLDGACSEKMIKKWAGKGVDGFVLGTSALFNNKNTYKERIKELRELI